MSIIVQYELPSKWILYNPNSVGAQLVEAKTAVLSLTRTPYQRNWVELLQQIQLKREVAGTSRIEGADFTEPELDTALKAGVTPEELITRSQRQAHSAVQTYRWISELPRDRRIDGILVREIHRRLVTGCDDDHCKPGALRASEDNVTFGIPRHRGCSGGEPCEEAFDKLMDSVAHEYRAHDPLIQALAIHYHIAAMHPFTDGNGRTARALEALMLQRAGLTDRAFIAMSNYYYDEKPRYLSSLAAVRAANHDLTEFLLFALRGIALQCDRLYEEIKRQTERALFRNMMYDLFNRLQSTRKRVIKDRQIEILKMLLEVDKIDWQQFAVRMTVHYRNMKSPGKTFLRDIASLDKLGAIRITKVAEKKWDIAINSKWPQEITESDFFETLKNMPKGKTYKFLP